MKRTKLEKGFVIVRSNENTKKYTQRGKIFVHHDKEKQKGTIITAFTKNMLDK